jgi:glucuronate isomerase
MSLPAPTRHDTKATQDIKMTYLSEDFLLHSTAARDLFHGFAEPAPILDYHSHLSPQAIAEDATFSTITKLWLGEDHYKWRAMRANGIDEQYITGKAGDREKFDMWARTVSRACCNPLYDWAHLELKRYFGITDLLSPDTASDIFAACNERLRDPAFSARNLLRKMNVKTVCTTDDPVDDLRFHRQLRRDGFEISVFPSFRPEKLLKIDNPDLFSRYCDQLSLVSGTAIASFSDLLDTVDKRHSYFHDHGCRSADIAMETVCAEQFTAPEIDVIFRLARSGKTVTPDQRAKFVSALLLELGRMNHRRGWVQQFHLGVFRNPRSRLFSSIGPDAGADCIGDFSQGRKLTAFLDALDRDNQLSKTILYNINPRDNDLFACIAGSFQDGSVPGKIQYGPAWWFADGNHGIVLNIRTLCTTGLLSRHIGMTTDSRSLLSFVRHEYFRRILCNLLGSDMENGDIPGDVSMIGALVRDICFNNARDYFGFQSPPLQTSKEKHEYELAR